MNKTLHLLQTCREARRDAASSRLAQARQAHAHAQSHHERAQAQAQAASQWREDVIRQHALGRNATAKESVLPSCDALLAQRAVRLQRAIEAVQDASQAQSIQQQQLARCERDIIRLGEWQRLEQQQQRQRLLRRDEALLEETNTVRTPGSTGTSPSPETGGHS